MWPEEAARPVRLVYHPGLNKGKWVWDSLVWGVKCGKARRRNVCSIRAVWFSR